MEILAEIIILKLTIEGITGSGKGKGPIIDSSDLHLLPFTSTIF